MVSPHLFQKIGRFDLHHLALLTRIPDCTRDEKSSWNQRSEQFVQRPTDKEMDQFLVLKNKKSLEQNQRTKIWGAPTFGEILNAFSNYIMEQDTWDMTYPPVPQKTSKKDKKSGCQVTNSPQNHNALVDHWMWKTSKT